MDVKFFRLEGEEVGLESMRLSNYSSEAQGEMGIMERVRCKQLWYRTMNYCGHVALPSSLSSFTTSALRISVQYN